VLYFSNKENRVVLTKLLLDEEYIVSSTEPTDHNFTTLGGHNSPSFHDNYACIPFGRDIIEVNLNAQPPIARRKNLYAYESAVQDPHFHKVERRNGIVSGEFITVSQNKHYFCFIQYMQPNIITCRVIEDMVKSENGGNEVEFKVPESLLPGVFSLSSMDDHLIVKRCVESEVYQVLDEPLF
jgi:hypothetical protein